MVWAPFRAIVVLIGTEYRYQIMSCPVSFQPLAIYSAI
jgi:hypothetical protein